MGQLLGKTNALTLEVLHFLLLSSVFIADSNVTWYERSLWSSGSVVLVGSSPSLSCAPVHSLGQQHEKTLRLHKHCSAGAKLRGCYHHHFGQKSRRQGHIHLYREFWLSQNQYNSPHKQAEKCLCLSGHPPLYLPSWGFLVYPLGSPMLLSLSLVAEKNHFTFQTYLQPSQCDYLSTQNHSRTFHIFQHQFIRHQFLLL